MKVKTLVVASVVLFMFLILFLILYAYADVLTGYTDKGDIKMIPNEFRNKILKEAFLSSYDDVTIQSDSDNMMNYAQNHHLSNYNVDEQKDEMQKAEFVENSKRIIDAILKYNNYSFVFDVLDDTIKNKLLGIYPDMVDVNGDLVDYSVLKRMYEASVTKHMRNLEFSFKEQYILEDGESNLILNVFEASLLDSMEVVELSMIEDVFVIHTYLSKENKLLYFEVFTRANEIVDEKWPSEVEFEEDEDFDFNIYPNKSIDVTEE